MRTITNECGTFYISDTGVLEKFECDQDNTTMMIRAPSSVCFRCLHIPEGVRILPENAFRGCGIEDELTFPDSLKVLGAGGGGAFSHCKLGEVTLPKCAEIGLNTFSGSCIGSVIIPDGADRQTMVMLAHALRFAHSFHVDEQVKDWPQEYADIYFGKSEPEDSWERLETDSGSFFIDSDGVLMKFDCDWENGGQYYDNIFRLHIPEGVAAIPAHMFSECHVLWEMTLPASLKYIGDYAFAMGTLPDLVLPEKLEILGAHAFSPCHIRSLTLPRGLEDSLLKNNVRLFHNAHIMEFRVPAECRKHLEAQIDELNMKIENGEWEVGEWTDPKLGPMFCLKARKGSLPGWGLLYRVLGLLE